MQSAGALRKRVKEEGDEDGRGHAKRVKGGLYAEKAPGWKDVLRADNLRGTT